MRILLPGMAFVLMVCLGLSGSTEEHPGQTRQQKNKAAAAARAQARADSIAADSVRAILVRATEDSIRRHADSLAAAATLPPVPTLRKIHQAAFGVGERLVFDVSYGYITAGEAVMAIPAADSVAGRPCYRVDFTVNSLPSFSWIYRVEDRYRTYIDEETIAPWKFEQHIREGSYQRDFVAEFDQHNLVAKTTDGDFPIPEYVHDIMSAFYYARTLDYSGYAVGDGPLLHNFFRNKAHELKVNFLGRQELEIEAGTFRSIVVEPIVKEGGLFRSEGRIVIWLSDDERKIPLRVNTKVVIGSIDTELREYSGLAGPLTSRIK